MSRRATWLGFACAMALPRPALAQQPLRFTAGATLAAVRVRTDLGSTVESLTGAALALDAGARRGPVLLVARYSEGRLTSGDASVAARDLVEGSLLLGVRLGSFVSVLVGPHVRAYHAPTGTSRWVLGEARVQASAPLIPSRLDAYGELGATLLGSSSLVTSFSSERSGEVGVRYRLPSAPLALRLAYRIERGSGHLPTRSDTVEQIVLGIQAGGR